MFNRSALVHRQPKLLLRKCTPQPRIYTTHIHHFRNKSLGCLYLVSSYQCQTPNTLFASENSESLMLSKPNVSLKRFQLQEMCGLCNMSSSQKVNASFVFISDRIGNNLRFTPEWCKTRHCVLFNLHRLSQNNHCSVLLCSMQRF